MEIINCNEMLLNNCKLKDEKGPHNNPPKKWIQTFREVAQGAEISWSDMKNDGRLVGVFSVWNQLFWFF